MGGVWVIGLWVSVVERPSVSAVKRHVLEPHCMMMACIGNNSSTKIVTTRNCLLVSKHSAIKWQHCTAGLIPSWQLHPKAVAFVSTLQVYYFNSGGRAACSGKRKKTGPKKTALKFEYDGEDLTCLEQKLTQAEIDRVLGTDLLVRAVFHGQADVTALLEVSSVESTVNTTVTQY